MHDGLAHACAAEQTGLAALDEGLDQVDGLDAGLEDLGRGRQVVERRGRTVDRAALDVSGMGLPSTGSPSTFQMRPRVALPTGIMMGGRCRLPPRPRIRPSVDSWRRTRTMLPGRCVSPRARWNFTRRGLGLHGQGVVDRRHASAGNSTSTTAPTIRTMRPVAPRLASSSSVEVIVSHLILQSCGAADDLGDLRGDGALAHRLYSAAPGWRPSRWRCR